MILTTGHCARKAIKIKARADTQKNKQQLFQIIRVLGPTVCGEFIKPNWAVQGKRHLKNKSTSPLGILRKDPSKFVENVHPRLQPLQQAKPELSKPELQRGYLWKPLKSGIKNTLVLMSHRPVLEGPDRFFPHSRKISKSQFSKVPFYWFSKH